MPAIPSVLIDIFRHCVWLMILVVIFVPLERLFAVHPEKILRKGIFVDLAYYFLNSLLPAFLLSVPVGLLVWAVNRVVPGFVLETTASMPLWARVIAGMVAGEIGYYWGHRWSHEIPFLWGFHAIHHSAEHCDFLVNSRAHPIDMVFGRFCMMVPIFVLGLGAPVGQPGTLVPVIVGLIGTVWGFFIHANVRWRFGPLEWLISTPAFHHWHHTKTGPIDRNYASTLPWLDWVFGSLYLPKEWPLDYGIKAPMPDSLVDQMFYPMMPKPVPPAPEVAAVATSSVPEAGAVMSAE
jgi:sterol desaturase/sphingolipid hydroxylase (fatty acid hydroxylase superfamily)